MKITIPGDPVAQGRPRFYRGRVVDPPKSKAWKEAARLHMKAACKNPIMKPMPVELVVHVCFKRPKSSKPDDRWKTTKPDLDNILKAVMDAGNGILWEDDSQVVTISASKFQAKEEPGVTLWFYEVGDGH